MFSHDNEREKCTKKTDRDSFFQKKKISMHSFGKKKIKKMPCYQSTGLGCPIVLLGGFPSKFTPQTHLNPWECVLRGGDSDLFTMTVRDKEFFRLVVKSGIIFLTTRVRETFRSLRFNV